MITGKSGTLRNTGRKQRERHMREKENLRIRQAGPADYEQVRDFYDYLIDAMEGAAFSPGWERDVYPTQEFLRDSLEKGELYAGEIDGRMVASMVVNHVYNEGYRNVRWTLQAADDALCVIHVLGVHPQFAGKGIAGQMARAAIAMAREKGIKTVRLDVLEGNLPAEKAYGKVGFQYVDTVRMFYEDTGWTNYKLYEYIV